MTGSQYINLKYIREYIFDGVTQEDFAKGIGIGYRTLQGYEGKKYIPSSKINKIKEGIRKFAQEQGVEVDFDKLPSSEALGLESFSDLEIVEYIGKNIDRFKAISIFQIAVGIKEVESLKKKIQLLEDRLNAR